MLLKKMHFMCPLKKTTKKRKNQKNPKADGIFFKTHHRRLYRITLN